MRDFVATTGSKMTPRFMAGSVADVDSELLVYSHVKRTGMARWPLEQCEELRDKIDEQLVRLQQMPRLVRLSSRAPSVVSIGE